jgi:hypothetical protein
MILRLAYLVISLLFLQFAHADASKWVGYGGPSQSSSSGLRFVLMGGLKFQHGSFGSNDNSISKRKLNAIGAEVITGLNWSWFVIGVSGEIHKWYQMTDPKDVENTNLTGLMTSYSGVGGLVFGPVCLLAKMYLGSTYKLDLESELGDKVSYTSPAGSYGLSLLLRRPGNTFWSLDYSTLKYEKEIRGSSTNTLDSNTSMNLSSIGLSYGFIY